MNLKYIIAIDFEATFNNQGIYGHEIIEFPAILMDLTNGTKLREFHEYVKPTRNSKLSAHCLEYTGINQSTVDNARPLQTVLQNFDNWLKIIINTYDLVMPNIHGSQINCVFISWGNDFKQFLLPECQTKGYKIPEYYKAWSDLRTTFNSKYSRGLISLQDALKYVDLEMVGRFHSGIDDARNLANLARRLYINGAKITSLTKY